MAKRKRPTLKDYLRTGVVQTAEELKAADALETVGPAETAEALNVPEAAIPTPVPGDEGREAREGEEGQEHVPPQGSIPNPEPAASVEPELDPEPAIDPEPELEVAPTPEPQVEPEPTDEPKPDLPPPPSAGSSGADAASMGDFLALLAPEDRAMWEGMLQAVTDVSRLSLDLPSLREDFRTADRDRFTYYLLSEEGARLSPVRTSVQIREPLRCVLKWDEMGSATLYEQDDHNLEH